VGEPQPAPAGMGHHDTHCSGERAASMPVGLEKLRNKEHAGEGKKITFFQWRS